MPCAKGGFGIGPEVSVSEIDGHTFLHHQGTTPEGMRCCCGEKVAATLDRKTQTMTAISLPKTSRAEGSPSGPCSYPAALVDAMLEDRDRIWCLALISAVPHIGTSRVHSILERFHDLRSREAEVLDSLDRGLQPRL